jgi:selenocysteine-specific translation elongation factor
MDLPDAKKNLEAMRQKFPKIDIIPTSAATNEGIDALKDKLAAMITDDKAASRIKGGQAENL